VLTRLKGNTVNALRAPKPLNRIIGVALLSEGVAVSGLTLAAGTAQALRRRLRRPIWLLVPRTAPAQDERDP
jgi:hypothetical protein